MSRFVSALVIGCAVFGAIVAPDPAAAGNRSQKITAPVRVSDIQAKLFFSNTGRFSSNILEKRVVLWNVIIGEGGVEGPSEDTLILVQLAGPPKGYVEGLKVQLLARTAKKVLAQRDVAVGIFNGAGSWYTPLLLNGTGCEPVQVTVALPDVPGNVPVSVELPFMCGE